MLGRDVVGRRDGNAVGPLVGLEVGNWLGLRLGLSVEGFLVGNNVGDFVGLAVGNIVGFRLGNAVRPFATPITNKQSSK